MLSISHGFEKHWINYVANINCLPKCPVTLLLYYLGAGLSNGLDELEMVYHLLSLMRVPLFELPLSPSLLGSTAYKHALEPKDTGFNSISVVYFVGLDNLFFLCELQFPHLSNAVSSKIAFQGSCKDQISWEIFYLECTKCLIKKWLYSKLTMMTVYNSIYVCYYLQAPIFKVQPMKLFLFQPTESFLPTNKIKSFSL